MLFQLEYKQSPQERYDTDVNEMVRQALDTARIEVVEEYGGSNLRAKYDDPNGSDAGFVVDTTLDKLSAVSVKIGEILKRPVEVTEVKS